MEKLTYISLFSSAGVGCYGFLQNGFKCIATNELLQRRLDVQIVNNKCKYKSGYIPGDILDDITKEKILNEIKLWKNKEKIKDVTTIIATPPCQGMSVANHKKKEEQKRNSLVIESIKLIKDIKPKTFIIENVRAFLNTLCTDIDGYNKIIKDAINNNLSSDYKIESKIINFKDYGSNSSRTRTVVIGVRKDINVPLENLFPKKQKEKTLRQVIGYLPSLTHMGEIDPNDIYHSFRKYNPEMLHWIKDLKEGEGAFDNTDPSKIPHYYKNGKKIFTKKKNSDKYTRQCWNKVAPCIHTRNDIFASQNTIHPVDNRVFSVRELMEMMSIPKSFKWVKQDLNDLNVLPLDEKEKLIKQNDINIRQSIGEAVPTIIFYQIAKNIKKNIGDIDE